MEDEANVRSIHGASGKTTNADGYKITKVGAFGEMPRYHFEYGDCHHVDNLVEQLLADTARSHSHQEFASQELPMW